jgi:hypothetical protein
LAPLIVGAVWKEGAPAPPDAGPANTEFCAALESEKDRAGVVVAVATLVVNSGDRLPAEKLVTVPVPTLIVLHPNPVPDVQVSALVEVEQDGTEMAVGDAELPVAFATTVFAACVARTLRGRVPGPATVPVNVGDAIDGLVANTGTPDPVAVFVPQGTFLGRYQW